MGCCVGHGQMHTYTHTHTHTQYRHRCTQRSHRHTLSPSSNSHKLSHSSLPQKVSALQSISSPHTHHNLHSQPAVCPSEGYVCPCVFVWTGCCNHLHILTLLIDGLASATKRMSPKIHQIHSFKFLHNSTKTELWLYAQTQFNPLLKSKDLLLNIINLSETFVQWGEHPLTSSRTLSRLGFE